MHGCISLYSYIKPQLTQRRKGQFMVVYPYIPTSNRNARLDVRQGGVLYPYIPTSNRNLYYV